MKKYCVSLVAALAISGCAQLPPDVFKVTETQLQSRQIETRRFDEIDPAALLTACSNVLQDQGFNLTNSDVGLGVLTADKQRDATDVGEIALAIFVAAFGGGSMAISTDQSIKVSVVVRPVQDESSKGKNHFVRATFQRVVRKSDNSTFVETLKDEALYKEFFDNLSKSVFIEGQGI